MYKDNSIIFVVEKKLKYCKGDLTMDIDNCRLESEKKWAKLQVEIQKIRDDQEVFIARLNKQAAMVEDIQDLSKSVALLASNMDGMLKELQVQGARLTSLEQKPAKRIDGIIDTIIKIVVTAAVGVILVKIGLG